MTARQARTERRAAERRQQNEAVATAASIESPSLPKNPSTGPKTAEGKARSSQNSFKHGIYSKQVVIPGEDPLAFEALRDDLRAEHQPATTTEELLVDELAQHVWRMNRFRRLEVQMWTTSEFGQEGVQLDTEDLLACANSGLFEVIHRALNSAERGFHRALTTLLKLKKETTRSVKPTRDEFVPAISESSATSAATNDHPEFVAAKSATFAPDLSLNLSKDWLGWPRLALTWTIHYSRSAPLSIPSQLLEPNDPEIR